MNREIKFRGLRIDGKGWAYGYYVFTYNQCFIIENEYYLLDEDKASENFIQVIGETVGQYIGIKGHRGEFAYKRTIEVGLYEGDIVEAWSSGSQGVFEIRLRLGGAPLWFLYPNFKEGMHWNINASDLGRQKGDYFDRLKLIGNIHENPEIMKGVSNG
jgi:hypothetical protein